MDLKVQVVLLDIPRAAAVVGQVQQVALAVALMVEQAEEPQEAHILALLHQVMETILVGEAQDILVAMDHRQNGVAVVVVVVFILSIHPGVVQFLVAGAAVLVRV